MYHVSEKYREAMKRPVQRHRIKGTVGRVSFTESDILSGSFSITGQCSDASMVQIGQVYTSELKITLLRRASLERYTLMKTEIAPHFGLRLDDGEYEYIPLGVFTISKANWGASGVNITAYDNMSKFDRDFSAESLSGTPYELLTLACTSCGLELGMMPSEFESFANGRKTLTLYSENDIQTWRDVVSWVAQTCACNAFADRDGRIILRSYDQVAVDTIDTEHRFTGSTFGDYETRYTGISVVDLKNEKTNYYSEEVDDGLTYNLGSNPFMQETAEGTVEEMCREILAAMGQIRYVPFTVDMIGNPAYDLMDVLKFEGGFADGSKLSCLTKYSFHYNAKYTATGVGSDPSLATRNSKTDHNLSGIMERIDAITSSINRLIYDYNTAPITVKQDEQSLGTLNFYISQTADVEGHFLMDYTASESTHLTLRFYDQTIEELYSPLEIDIHEGEGTIGIPHAYLNRVVGIHSVYVTAQVLSGELSIDTRGVFFSIDAGNFAVPVDEIAMDVKDITLRQLMESNGPDQVWIIGIEKGKVLVSKRQYSENQTSRPEWKGEYTPGKGIAAAIEFDGSWVLREQAERYTLETQDQPWYFWVDESHVLYGQFGNDEETRIALGTDVANVAACKGYSSNLFLEQDQGLVIAFIKTNGKAFYRQYVLNTGTGRKQWLSETALEPLEEWADVRVHRLNDYRIGFELSNSSHNVWLISERTYVNQASPPQFRSDYLHPSWMGLSVITPTDTANPVNCYRGKERPFVGEPRVTTFFIDFDCPVQLYNSPYDIITTKVNGAAYSGKYSFKTEDNSLIIEYEDTLSGIVEITVKPWVHYLVGNGINYMFTESVSYTWEVVSRIYAPMQYDGRMDVLNGQAVSIKVRQLKTIRSAQSEKRKDTLSASLLNIGVKQLVPRKTKDSESRMDSINAAVAIVVTQTGAEPI